MLVTRKRLQAWWNSPTLNTWASLGTSAARFLFVLPLVLSRFAPPDVAVWYLIATFVQFQSYLDFGFGVTTSRYYAYAIGGATDLSAPHEGSSAGPNHGLIARIYRTMRALMLPIALASLLVIGGIGTALLIRPIAATSSPGHAWLAWGVMALSATIGFWGLTYSSYLQGTDRVAIVRRWEAITNVGAIITSVVALKSGGAILSLAVASLVWTLVNLGRDRWLVHRYAGPGLSSSGILDFDREILRQVWGSAWRSGLGVVLNAGVVRLSAGLLAQFVGATDLAAYLIAFNVLDRLNQFAMAPFYSKLPQMGALYARGDRAGLLGVAKRGMLTTLLLFVIGAAILGLTAERLLSIAHSSTPFIGIAFWTLLAFGLLLHRYGAMNIQLVTLTNKVVWHIADGAAGVVFLVCWATLVPTMGVIGMPISIIIAYGLVYTPYVLVQMSRSPYWRTATILTQAA